MLEVEEPSTDDVNTRSSYENILKNILRKHFGKTDITLRVKGIEDVVSKGNNFFGELRRISLEISRDDLPTEEKILVVKELTKNETLRQYAKEAAFSQKENVMYKLVLPEINRIATNVFGNSSFSAQYFDTDVDDFIVMEDLKQAGYKMADRLIGLDFKHCKLAMRSIARFHGISVATAEVYGPALDALPESIYQRGKEDVLDLIFRSRFEALSEVVETWPGYERFGVKLRNAGLKAAKTIVKLNDRRNTELEVLNHGDFWVNNMLFKYSDAGEPEDVKIVDFQTSRRCSPAFDLHYFLVTSPDDEVRTGGVTALLEAYHAELCRVLEALGCGDKVKTFDWLRKELKDKMFSAVHDACGVLNILVSKPADAVALSEETDQTGYSENMYRTYNGTRYREILEKLLLLFEKEGVI